MTLVVLLMAVPRRALPLGREALGATYVRNQMESSESSGHHIRWRQLRLLRYKGFVSLEEIRQISAAIPAGWWTTYQDIGELVYGHRRAMQPIGDFLGRAGDVDGAHRILRQGGHISNAWQTH